MAGGRMIRVVKAQPKKKVLSNKALTSRVRALSGLQGERRLIYAHASAETTVPSTSGTLYQNIGCYNYETIYAHSIKFDLWMTAAASEQVRFLFCLCKGNGIGAVSDFLDSANIYASYNVNQVRPGGNSKNLAEDFPVRVLKDITVTMNANSSNLERHFSVSIPLKGKKMYDLTQDSDPEAFKVLAISTGTIATFNLRAVIDATVLDNI